VRTLEAEHAARRRLIPDSDEAQHVPKNRELEPERMGLTSPPAPLRVRECAIARADREFAAGIAAIEGHAYDHAVAMAPISWPGH